MSFSVEELTICQDGRIKVFIPKNSDGQELLKVALKNLISQSGGVYSESRRQQYRDEAIQLLEDLENG